MMGESRYVLRGDVDLAVAARVRDELAQLVARGDDLLIDCSELTFIDSSGVSVLCDTNVDVAANGNRMRLMNMPRPARRVFELLGLDDLLPDRSRHPRVAVGVAPPVDRAERERKLAVKERDRAELARRRAAKHGSSEVWHQDAAVLHDDAAELHDEAARLFDHHDHGIG